MRECAKHNYPAHKAVRMPLRVQRRNVILHDGAVAAVALGRKHVKVVVATVRLAVALMEAILAKLLAALGAEKVLRVPCLLQRGDAFLYRKKQTNWYTAYQMCICDLSLRTSKMAPLQYAHRGLNKLW